MFFSISNQVQQNFPNNYLVGNFVINTDPGWLCVRVGSATVVYKGYADQFDLSKNIETVLSVDNASVSGNFCLLVHQDNSIKVYHSQCRSFPVYANASGINNLTPTDKPIWSNQSITVNSDLSITETKFNAIGDIDTSTLSREEVEKRIIEILDRKTQQFLSHNTLPVKLFLSGGVDSISVYSFLKKHTTNYERVKCFHYDLDHFFMKNNGDLHEHWGYTQIHHWNDPCVVTSGTPGDEYTLRAPLTGAMLLHYHGVDIIDLIKNKHGMQKSYFLQDKNIEIFNKIISEPPVKNKTLLFHQLCTINSNDHQHWHIGNTLTWTPLRDLEIFKLYLRLPVEDQIDQFLDSKITKNIIEHNCPGLSKWVADQKNTGNTMKNLLDK